jgi:AAA domain
VSEPRRPLPNSRLADPDEIRRAIDLTCEPGAVYEVRAPDSRQGTASGYFSEPAKLAAAAARLSGQAPGVYITLNPVNPDLLARAANRSVPFAKATTTDADIFRRRYLLFDFDPERAAHISATDEEHAAAIERARRCREWLAQHGVGLDSQMLADSGNGGHVQVAIDLPNDDESTRLVNRCLQAAALYLDGDRVRVDQTTGNAARISKVYGTLAAKGDSLPDRPHRIARILEAPADRAVPVPRETLEAIAALVPEPKREPSASRGTALSFDLPAFVSRHGLDVVREADWNGGTKFVLRVCPLNPEHTNLSAVIIQHASGAVSFSCHHNSCRGNDWRTLRAMLEPEGQRDLPGPSVQASGEIIPAADLLARAYPPVKWIVPELIPEGLTLLAAKPKMGKTWLGLGLAVAVAAGGAALVSDWLVAGRCLYLGLEDGDRRIQERLRQLLDGAPAPATLDFKFECPRLDEGGLGVIENWITRHDDARLIVVDTLKRVRPLTEKGQSLYDADYEALAGLADLAHKHNVAVMVLYHLRKMPGVDDPFDEISGSTGLQAAPDTLIVLRRIRGKAEAALHVTGRVVRDDQALAMAFDSQTGLWRVTGDLDERQQSEARREVIEAIEEAAEAQTPKQVSELTGKPHGGMKQLMRRMGIAGELTNDKGRYSLPDPVRSGDEVTPGDSGQSHPVSGANTPHTGHGDTVTPSAQNRLPDATAVNSHTNSHPVTLPSLPSAGAENAVTSPIVTRCHPVTDSHRGNGPAGAPVLPSKCPSCGTATRYPSGCTTCSTGAAEGVL